MLCAWSYRGRTSGWRSQQVTQHAPLTRLCAGCMVDNLLVGRVQILGIAYPMFKILNRKAQDTDLSSEGTTPRLANRFNVVISK